jgi:hypothetical protein
LFVLGDTWVLKNPRDWKNYRIYCRNTFLPLKLFGSSKLRLNNGSALKLQFHLRILIRYSSHRVRPLKILRNLNLTATAERQFISPLNGGTRWQKDAPRRNNSSTNCTCYLPTWPKSPSYHPANRLIPEFIEY